MIITARHLSSICILLGFLATTAQGAQTCRDDIASSTPDDRFVINGAGTVQDTATGLIWKRCAEGQAGTDCGTGSVISYH